MSSKAFKGEGHRLGSTSTVPTAAPPNGGQRITPATAVATPQATPQATKPTNNTSGTSTDGNKRSAAARAAEQRAESVSKALPLSLTNPPGSRETHSPRKCHS